MGFISHTAKKVAFWNYSRTSWQWDVLCVVILAFIFLTPKSWFEGNAPVQTGPATATVWASDLVGGQGDAEIEQRAKQKLTRPNGQVVGKIRPKTDSSGKVIAYEVDIR